MEAILKQVLGDASSDWTKLLTSKTGFQAGDAGKFIQQVIEKVSGLVKGGDLSKLLDVGALKSKFDVASLASTVGIDATKASQGLDALLPDLVNRVKQHAGGAEGLLGKLSGKLGGDASGALGNLFGK